MPINDTQKNILDATINFWLSNLSELPPQEALDIIVDPSKSNDETAKQIQQVLSHPYPQNRSDSYPYCGQQEGLSAYPIYDENNEFVRAEFEPAGLLSLTSRQNPGETISAQEVKDYIRQSLDNHKKKCTT